MSHILRDLVRIVDLYEAEHRFRARSTGTQKLVEVGDLRKLVCGCDICNALRAWVEPGP